MDQASPAFVRSSCRSVARLRLAYAIVERPGFGVMEANVTPLERAFQLAKSGQYESVEAIKQQLRQEGYSSHQIEGRTLVRQLASIIKATSKDATRR